MSDLKLDSLRIQNFRTFKDLTIDHLGRVNLIVGKNNVGKTSLLRAVWLWAHPEYWRDLAGFLDSKYPRSSREPDRVTLNRRLKVLREEFHSFPYFSESDEFRIEIGPKDSEDNESICIRFVSSDNLTIHITPGYPYSDQSDSRINVMRPSSSVERYESKSRSEFNYIPSSGIDVEDAGRIWDEAIRSNLKQRVLEILSLTIREVEDVSCIDVNWIKEPSLDTRISGSTLRRSSTSDEDRVPMITLSRQKEAIPLSSFGEGTERTLWIGSAIVNSQHGMLLIDEIENGLHYSVQPRLWRMIFETAQELDVQVFATTHSYDCVQAFQQVSGEHEEEGMLISLRRKRSNPEEITAVPIEEEELEYAVETHTDVR